MKKLKRPNFEQERAFKVQRRCRIGVGLLTLCLLAFLFLVVTGCAPAPLKKYTSTIGTVDSVMVGTVVRDETIFERVEVPFDSDSSTPLSSAALFGRDYDLITVEGHADARGSDAYNDELSRRRAEAVAAGLHGLDVSGKIVVEAFGKRKPLCYDMTESCHARNRRVVVKTQKGGHARP